MSHRLVVLASGGGSNLEAILEAQARGELPVKVVLVISSRPDAFALQRARKRDILTAVIEKDMFPDEEQYDQMMLDVLSGARPDLICLAGYMRKLGPRIIEQYHGRILNIHPALLPKYGGKGMFGKNVHEAVLRAGEKESGCSVHLVDEEFDHGPVLAQARVPVLPGDTADTLAARVLAQEHKLYPQAIKEFCATLRRS